MLRPMKLRHLLLVLLAAPALPGLTAQDGEPRLQLAAKFVPAKAQAGSTVTLRK